jgi:hypothetical protein
MCIDSLIFPFIYQKSKLMSELLTLRLLPNHLNILSLEGY